MSGFRKLQNFVPQPLRSSKVSKYNFGDIQALSDDANGIGGDAIIYASTLDGLTIQEVTAQGRLLSSAAASYMKAHSSKFVETKLVKFTAKDYRTDPVTGATVEGVMVGVRLERR